MRQRQIRIRNAAALIGMFLASVVQANTFMVTRGDDPSPNGCLAGDCSLREALEAAVTTPAGDVVLLGAGLYNVTRGQLVVVGQVAIQGAGSASTSIVGAGAFDLMSVPALGALSLDGVTMSSQEETLIAEDSSAFLHDVTISAGSILAQAPGSGSASLRVEQSHIGGLFACGGDNAVCQAFDSELNGVAVTFADIELARVEMNGVANGFGVYIAGEGSVKISDSTIRGQSQLTFKGSGDPAPDATISRTRFIGNFGPLSSDRNGTMRLVDVEFRDNIVNGANNSKPAVILASNEGAWRISRALFVGNRGGTGEGGAVRVTGGANVVMDNITFDDNTFKTGLSGHGNTIGVDVTNSTSTIFWLFNATLRRASIVASNVAGSVLSVNGSAANVRLYNSLVDGTCAFGSGGLLFQAQGNVESIGNTCALLGIDNNRFNIAANQLRIGSLADHGGFTRTYLPASGSPLLDTATPIWCQFGAIDQRRYLRPSGGIACDIGAVEAGARQDTIFSTDFE